MASDKLGPRSIPPVGSGSIHCGFYDEVTDEQHNHYFKNMEDYRQHLFEMAHLHSGHSACNDCGTPGTATSWYGKLHPSKLIAPTVCSDCKKKRKEEAES